MNIPSRAKDALDRAELLLRAGIPLPPRGYFKRLARLDVAVQVREEVLAGPDALDLEVRGSVERTFREARAAALEARLWRGRQIAGAA